MIFNRLNGNNHKQLAFRKVGAFCWKDGYKTRKPGQRKSGRAGPGWKDAKKQSFGKSPASVKTTAGPRVACKRAETGGSQTSKKRLDRLIKIIIINNS
jgi:hypothetical protein